MIGRICRCACGVLLLPLGAGAQTLNGVAEWAVVRGSQTSSDGADDPNRSFWQRYTVGYSTPVLDPRLLRCNAEASFRTTTLATGSQATVQEGRQRDVSYNLGASAFPARPFPFYFEAMRDTVGESGDYPASNGIRGGIPLPPGTPRPDFQTRNKAVNMGWQLNAQGMPRLELGYRTRQSQVSGGPFDAEQTAADLHAGIFKDTARTRHSLRFQRTSFENAVSQVFDQRISDLDYDLGVTLGRRSRGRIHAGRRGTFSHFDLPSAIVDPGTGGYSPPSGGQVDADYAIAGVTYEPSGRVSIDFAGNMDRQHSADVLTTAALATTTARFDVARGLSLNAAGAYGSRGQVVLTVPIRVRTETGQVGASYRGGARWLTASAGVTRGIGSNVAPDGRSGPLDSWTGQTGVTMLTPLVGVSLGYDRAISRDAILSFGNYDSARQFGAVQRDLRRLSLSATFENSLIARGLGETAARNHQQTYTTSAAFRHQDHTIAANGGGFKNRSEAGRDVVWFWGGSYQAQIRRSLRASVWVRRERTTSTETHLDQQSLVAHAEAEYRYRQFRFAAEYRRNNQRLLYERLVDPYVFRGGQLMVRITRTFGFRL